MPLTPTGPGLPTNLINQVIVTQSGMVLVATTTGLAWSTDHGHSFSYVRGQDYVEKVKGLAHPPKHFNPNRSNQPLLLEDYITALGEETEADPQHPHAKPTGPSPPSKIWVCYREQGYECLNVATGQRYASVHDPNLAKVDGYCTAVLPLENSTPLIARYGGSIVQLAQRPSAATNKQPPLTALSAAPKNTSAVPSLPSEAKPPSDADLADLLVKANAAAKSPKLKPGDALYLGQDWITQGDWVGRYGRNFAVLCSAGWPLDHVISFSTPHLYAKAMVGPHSQKDESLRHWLHWATTENPKCLWDPELGHRRQSEWDDHGESYSLAQQGPDIWIRVDVPQGIHVCSFYFMNKDGHDANNRIRDYVLQLRRLDPNLSRLEGQKPLCQARVKNFWGGEYQSFQLVGPASYAVKLDRNYSFNAICSAVFLDRVGGKPLPTEKMPLPWLGNIPYGPPVVKTPETLNSLATLWASNEQNQTSPSAAPAAPRKQLILAYRFAAPLADNSDLLANLRWRLKLWNNSDRQDFLRVMTNAWESEKAMNPHLMAYIKPN